jgi:hypothetical protein
VYTSSVNVFAWNAYSVAPICGPSAKEYQRNQWLDRKGVQVAVE